eukprot:1158248-Pelagomonas_calceolata.AAC.1
MEMKYWEDMRPGAQLTASQQQRSELCKLQGTEITLHTILLGVGGTIDTAHTLDQFKELRIDPLRSAKFAQKLHVHSVQHAQKLTSTRRAIAIKNARHNSGALGLHASRKPPNPH